MPLRAKLVGLYTLILLVIIAAFSVLLVIGTKASLVAAVDRELEARARSLVALVEFENGKWFVEPKSGLLEEYGQGTGRYYIVMDAQGKKVLSSVLADSPVRDVQSSYREITVTAAKQRDVEEGGVPINVRVVCGKSMAQVEESMASLIAQLLFIGPLVLLVSIAGGLLLVSRALRPIDRMAATAEQISAHDLSRRIEISGDDELARLGKTLNEMFSRLQESFDRQTRFTADASHELRTPLSVIAGNVEFALKKPRSAEEYHDILRDISDVTERMRSIVEGLLTLARADSKSIALKRERVSLTEIAKEIVKMCAPLADKRGVTLALDSSSDVRVIGDPDRLKELVSNLVVNAITYNKPGGSVTVRIATENDKCVLTVADTGIGIPAEDLPHIFERFYRVDKARSREVGGTGLGLAIVKWIVDAHNGTISVTSKPGAGTQFTVVLAAAVIGAGDLRV